jgi:hypothetical protein
VNQDYSVEHIEGFKALFGRFLVEIAVLAFRPNFHPLAFQAVRLMPEGFVIWPKLNLSAYTALHFFTGDAEVYCRPLLFDLRTACGDVGDLLEDSGSILRESFMTPYPP